MDEIIDTDAVGKRYMKLFYEANQEQIRSITRLDERGSILHNFPSCSPVGTDISDQKHVRELLRDNKPVISDVFKAVEGFDAVALHVPVFRGSVFCAFQPDLIQKQAGLCHRCQIYLWNGVFNTGGKGMVDSQRGRKTQTDREKTS